MADIAYVPYSFGTIDFHKDLKGNAMLEFIGFVFFLVFVTVVVIVIGYNKLRLVAEVAKESLSNVKVALRKRNSMVNQLIDVVKNYADHEKLVMLKVSEDMTTTSVQQAYQQSGTILSTVAGMAQKFPELHANTQFVGLQNSIRDTEDGIQKSRVRHNADVRAYNSVRGSLPWILFAQQIGFSAAPYLNFDGESESDLGAVANFAPDDAALLKDMLGNAGQRALSASKGIAGQIESLGQKAVSAAQGAMANNESQSSSEPPKAP